jgi:hypothetical protein
MRVRFTIRDLLWLTLVVALCLGWSVDHWRKPGGRYRLVETESELRIIDNETGNYWEKDDRDHWTLRGHKIHL